MNDSIKITGRVTLKVTSEGKVRRLRTYKNVITTDLLENIVRTFNMQSNAISAYDYIALGSGDTEASASDVGLDNEFSASSWGATGAYGDSGRINGTTGIDLTSLTYTVSGNITNNSGSTITVKEAGLFSTDTIGSTGDMGSRRVTSPTPVEDGEKLYCIWTYTIS